MTDMFQQAGAVATKVVDRWSWWRTALSNPAEIGKSLKASEDSPMQGYYRTRFKGGQWLPVAIFYPEGSDQLIGYRNGKEVGDVNELWVWSLRQPISYEAYEKAMAGGGFDDEPPAPIGDNSGSTDPFEALRLELAGEIEQAAEFAKREVKTQADADRAGIWAKRIADIGKRADGLRVVEKEPHLAAGRAVDDKWRDPIADAKDWAARLKRHVEPFLIAQKRAEEARARAAAEEAARLRREAEAAAAAARAAPEVDEKAEADRARMIQQAQEAEKAAEVRNAQAGRTGAKVSLRTEKIGVVTDYAKAAAALVAMKHPDFIAEIDRLAKAAAKKNFPFDGMEIREEERVI